ncbi:MAG TPA: transporter [Stellaceae bacterium]|nr:transporter [Stellaceae bacterium]
MNSCAALVALAGCAALSGAARGEELRDLCPDRPGKGTSPCTVDAGHLQIEADIVDGAFQRSGGVTTDTYAAANPTVKYGLTDRWDIEANLAPFVAVRSHDETTGQRRTVSGIGDLFLRTKVNIVGNGGGSFSIAVDPFLKLPAARIGIGDGAVEGGLVVPMSLDLGGGWSLGMTPEIDLLKNAMDSGRHPAAVGVIGLGRAVAGGVTLGAELWTSQDIDPAGTTRQYSFDLDAAWQPADNPNLQFDGGVNRGLNANTPSWQVYIGVSRRF